MKYGMRERVSGVVIVLALAVIFLPMLLDEPAPREDEQPKPQMSVEKPIEVERHEVETPSPPPVSVGSIADPMPHAEQSDKNSARKEKELAVRETTSVSETKEPSASSDQEPAANKDEVPSTRTPETSAPQSDPIAELAEQKQTSPEPQPTSQAEPEPSAANAQGSWSVQAGSFGQADNAERLEAKLKEQGFDAYRRQRDNNLTTVYVGPYPSSEAGEKARSELKSKANIQGLLVRTDR
ncbi:SPOR domain-containing protein [Pistricoccus aurantiacus]|uniref:SPOR domain-containing protein n=1 Tax=Pistricoccus aurantiacus TaxID=1883414 RepID=UPI00362608D7